MKQQDKIKNEDGIENEHDKDPLDALTERLGDAWPRLVRRLGEVNRDIATRGIRSFEHKGDLLTGYSYNEYYDWDLYFENIYMSYWGISRYCRSNLEVFLDTQLACGFVPRTLIGRRWRHQFKPFLAQIALLGSRQTQRFDWLAGKYYDRLKKYLDYWFWFSDFDNNGLCVWDSADHSGMDNQDRRAGAFGEMVCEGVDLNCYLLRELRAMAILARELGHETDAAEFTEHAEKLSRLINDVFWDDADGFYYDRHERTGELIRIKSVAGFIPLWLGIVPADRAERLVTEHLLNEDEFWLPYPVAAWAKTEPDYYQQRRGAECNWRGTTWIPTNYMVFHGLRRQGFEDVARQLADKTFELVLREENTREYYNAETGAGQGLNPFWGWSALAYFMPLEYQLGYDPTDLDQTDIRALGRDVLGLTFE